MVPHRLKASPGESKFEPCLRAGGHLPDTFRRGVDLCRRYDRPVSPQRETDVSSKAVAAFPSGEGATLPVPDRSSADGRSFQAPAVPKMETRRAAPGPLTA